MRGVHDARRCDAAARASASAPAPRWCSARRHGDAPVYGVNTGFGKLANQRISAEPSSTTLQLNLIRSHSVGVGEPLAPRGGAADAGAEGAPAWRAATPACARR